MPDVGPLKQKYFSSGFADTEERRISSCGQILLYSMSLASGFVVQRYDRLLSIGFISNPSLSNS